MGRITFILMLLAFTCHIMWAQQKPPVAMDDSVSAYAGTKLYIDVMENDYWMEGHRCRIFAVSIPNTNVTFNDSLIIYDTRHDEQGIRRIQYVLEDMDNATYSEVAMLKVNFINSAFGTLKVGKLNASFNARGNHCRQTESEGSSSFLCMDDGTKKPLIQNMTLWIGGKDKNDQIHLAAETGDIDGENDFWMGPVSHDYNVNYVGRWSRIWKISKEEVDYHRSNWRDPFYIPSEALTAWPGGGDHYKREVMHYAPFVDYNQDGIYDPMDGDYPDVPGDEALFFIYNDDALRHASAGKKLGVEVRGMAYVYHHPGNEALENAVFVHYEIVNRSDTAYQDTYLGVFANMAIGEEGDDFIECDIIRNSFLGFNGDSIDGPADPAISFGKHPPAVSVTILKSPEIAGNMKRMSTFMAYHLDGQAEYCQVPDFEYAYYLNMMGYWRDGSRMEYGGKGHPSNGAVGPYCNFALPGNSDPYNLGTNGMLPNGGYNQDGKYWTELAEQHSPHKISGLAAMGPFLFEPGETKELDIVFVYAQDTVNPGPNQAMPILRARIDSIRYYFENNCFPEDDPPSAITEADGIDDIIFYPNPCRDVVRFKIQDSRGKIQDSRGKIQDSRGKNFVVEVFDMSGRKIISKQIIQNEIDVSYLSPGLYIVKIIDGNNSYPSKLIIK